MTTTTKVFRPVSTNDWFAQQNAGQVIVSLRDLPDCGEVVYEAELANGEICLIVEADISFE